MYQSGIVFKSLLFIFALLYAGQTALGQVETKTQPDRDYELALQVVIGSNEAGGSQQLPSSLSNISKQLRSNFAFSNYRMANSFVGRVSGNGDFEYKSVSNEFGQEAEGMPQSFLEWSIRGLRVTADGVQPQAFRFGARLPVRVTNARDETGKTSAVYNYESIGLNITRVGLQENVPTLLGSLSLPKTNGTLFLVLTVSPVKR